MPDITRESQSQNTGKIKEITDKLEQGIKDLFDGEKFKEYLNTMSKFHNYSFNNTLLIAMQKPDASLVAGFNSWKNQFGRHVNKGEKGIQILAPAPFTVQKETEKIDEDTGLPMLDRNGKPIVEEVEVIIPYFKVVPVFDVSQTNGKELPSLGADELTGEVKNYEKFFEELKTVSPVPIRFEKIVDDGKGYYHHGDKRIAINEGMSELQNVKTAIHEIAHAKLHDRDLIKADLAEPKDRKTIEVEAESIAYTVCQHYGIDTSDYSFGYIAAWGSGKEMPELKSSLETIRATANEIINKIDEQFLDKLSQLDRNSPAGEEKTENSEKQSNITGNTKYADIDDKKYFKLETAVALAVAAELEKQGIPFSGRKNEKTTTLTISGADVDKFKAIGKEVNAEIKTQNMTVEKPVTAVEKPETKVKSNIIGNTKYTDIEDKKFFNVKSDIADKMSAGMESKGVKFSGKVNDNNITTFTVSATDVDKFKAVEKEITAQNKAVENSETTAKSNIIGNTKYADIPDKKYFKADSLAAEKISAGLETLGVKFSGRANGDTTTFTVSAADSDKFLAEVDKSAPSVTDLENQVGNGESISLMDLVKAQQAEKSNIPQKDFPEVYINNLSFAREHGEIAAYKESKQLDLDCAAAIDEAISTNSKPGPMAGTQYVDTEKAMKDVTEKFGIERVKAVTATIVADQDWDGRLSNTNKNWAKNIDLLCHDVYTKTHLSIFDGFVDKVRNCEKILDKKPSIHDKLQAKPPESTAKNDDIKKNKGEAEL